VKSMQLGAGQLSATQSPLTRINTLSRRNQPNAFRSRHVRRTRLQAPLTAVVAKSKFAQNFSDVQLLDTVLTRKQGDVKTSRKIQNSDPNNNNYNASENKENSNNSIITHTKLTVKNNTSSNGCGNKANGKIKILLPPGAPTLAPAPGAPARKLPSFAQQPPQKFTLGNPRNRKHYRTPLTLSQKAPTMKRLPKSHSVGYLPVIAE